MNLNDHFHVLHVQGAWEVSVNKFGDFLLCKQPRNCHYQHPSFYTQKNCTVIKKKKKLQVYNLVTGIRFIAIGAQAQRPTGRQFHGPLAPCEIKYAGGYRHEDDSSWKKYSKSNCFKGNFFWKRKEFLSRTCASDAASGGCTQSHSV